MPEKIKALQAALNGLPVGVSWASLQTGRVLYMNRALTEMLGYVPADFSTIADWARIYVDAAAAAHIFRVWQQAMEALGSEDLTMPEFEVEVRCRDGRLKTVISGGVLLPQNGWALATFVDISERKQYELRLLEAERRAREQQVLQNMLLAHSQEMIVISPRDKRRRSVSPGVRYILGYTPEEYLAYPLEELMHRDHHEALRRMCEQVLLRRETRTIRMQMRRKDGEWRWIEALVKPYEDPETREVLGYIASMIDVTERKELEDRLNADNRRLQYLAGVDELTELANRRAFNRALDREAARHTRTNTTMSLLLLDVDFFKAFNDQYGHIEGDACLRKVAEAMRSTMSRATDVLARYGGEEFAILLPGTDLAGAEKIARDVLRAITSLAIAQESNPAGVVTASIGVACWPPAVPVDKRRLLELADKALYAAKNAGRGTFRTEHVSPST